MSPQAPGPDAPGPAVAVIGMAGRFPGADDIETYWNNLCSGVESISFFSEAELVESGVDPGLLSRPNYVHAAPVLDDPSQFDAAFFGYSPAEARLIDPQQRLFLECCWTALEHAGHDPQGCPGPVGVYAGQAMNTYFLRTGGASRLGEEYALTLSTSDKDFLATRVSYKLDLTGPSMTVQTACSTSLTAVHLASQSLLYGECDLALAGGVAVRVPHRAGYLHLEHSIMSADGHCRAFDSRADGTVFGSGVGVVVLKRLAEAVADRDTVHAVIRGSAVNNDGSGKVSYTAPSLRQQSGAMVQALADAGVDPATVGYIETHGTGTRLGDPIEVAALQRAYATSAPRSAPCVLGSVKTNIGHLDAAAGVAGLIKAVLAIERAEIPPTLHFREPNPEIDFSATPFVVTTTLAPWPAGPTPRRAAVNALGAGGTNVHLVLEAAPAPAPSSGSRPFQLFPLSARTPTALAAVTSVLAEHLQSDQAAEVADVAHTLQRGRHAFACRRVVVGRDRDDAVTRLRAAAADRSGTAASTPPSIAFLLPGQGSQHLGMGAELYAGEPVFRQRMELCADLFRAELGLDLRTVLYPATAPAAPAGRPLDQTHLTQPALFSVEYALAGLWASWGVHPQALLGHSVGELVAACLADVMSLADAVGLVAERGRLMQDRPPGSLLAVAMTEDVLRPYLGPDLAVSAVNGPSQCVVAGERPVLAELAARLEADGARTHHLAVNRAFHSPAMDAVVEPFRARVAGVALHPPRIPLVSNVTGTYLEPEQAVDPAYWADQLRRTVRYSTGVQTLLGDPRRLLLEVGPGQVLTGLSRQHPRVRAASSLPGPTSSRSETEQLLTTLGELWVAGTEVDWAGFSAPERRRRVPLPTYPFERRRYWADAGPDADDQAPAPAPGPPAAPVSPVPAAHLTPPASVQRHRDERWSPVEAVVADSWRQVLGVVAVDRHDNFYELGGHSMLVAQVVARLSGIFRIDLPILSLVESPTVAGLARCIEDVFVLARPGPPAAPRGVTAGMSAAESRGVG